MSLLLTGSKTATIAGTVLQCIEVYTGESYTLPFTFTDSIGDPINITSWTLSVSCKWYNVDITYPNSTSSVVDIILSNLVLINPQPSQPAGLATAIVSGAAGTGYIYIPNTITPAGLTPTLTSTTLMGIVTLSVSRTDAISSSTSINLEPIGMIIRYL